MSPARRIAIAVAAATLLGAGAGVAVAAFTSTTANPGSSFSAKRVSSGVRTISAWKISDAADGTASDESAPVAFDDALFFTTKTISNTWSASRYVDIDFSSLVPAGLTSGTATFDLDFSDNAGGGGEISCVYAEVRRTSTGTVVSTHGSTGAPLGCETTQTIRRISTALPAVTTATVANDLTVRLYVQNSGGAHAMRIHRANITFTRYGHTWTQYRTQLNDQSNGIAASTTWGPVAADGAVYQSVGNWAATFSATRYVAATFAAAVPSGAAVTGATLRHRYKAATGGDTMCWYAEAWSGGVKIGTYGSSGTPISCNGTTSFVTDTVQLPEVDTGPEANDLTVRIYASVTGARKSQTDLLDVQVTSSLSSAGCVQPGTFGYSAVADSWTDQNAPTSVNGGTANDVRVKSQNLSRNRRAYVRFTLPVTPAGCSLIGAKLRLVTTGVQGTRMLQVARADAAWTEAALNWNTQPGSTGTPVTFANAAGTLLIDVFSFVPAMMSSTDNGFVIKDTAEDAATAAEQRYGSREGANPPKLMLTWG